MSSARAFVHADAEALARAGALEIARAARSAIEAHGRFDLALAGGSTPKRMYELLDTRELPDSALDWSRTHVWFGDERCVPPDHAGSNYRMACVALLGRVAIPAPHVHRMRGEDDAANAARAYEAELEREFGARATIGAPRLDLVLLGMGPDGHTASLFPGTSAVDERERWCVANWVEQKRSPRITLTLPVLDAARRVMFVVAGADKREMLERVRAQPDAAFPASLVRTSSGVSAVEWWLDRAAGA